MLCLGGLNATPPRDRLSGLQCLLNISGDYAAEHEVARPSEMSRVLLNDLLKDDSDIRNK